MKITMNKGWERELQKQIVNSPEWKRHERAFNDELNKVRKSMAGHPAPDVRATLVRELPDLATPANKGLLAQLVEEISA